MMIMVLEPQGISYPSWNHLGFVGGSEKTRHVRLAGPELASSVLVAMSGTRSSGAQANDTGSSERQFRS